jgi:hypothetical protein
MMVVRKLRSYQLAIPDKPGEMARVLQMLRAAGVNLVGAWGFSTWGGQGELFIVPEDHDALLRTTGKAGLSAKEAICFHVSDENRLGAAAEVLEKIAGAGVNLAGADAVAVGDELGMVLWSHEPDKLSAALGIS